MGRMTVKVLHGSPDARDTAALLTVLTVALDRALAQGPVQRRPERRPHPAWRAFTGHDQDGWGPL
ncbi:acyl-CoA carboxylase epsilon subunit [Actinacidiphila acididurans]|uniref:Acyl-CoA carboxylase subunit epsilon n=1 Tax=Actinacidiphila acididurans TaxID=2784346 RepID=A0ABS2TXX5_9ACTN|nr:acyl-CoA carboxylase epsilon subunit [Actinacidiphila acididurans]MBM9508199.1 hypothetical protein [Actinacidiphila acididurans]